MCGIYKPKVAAFKSPFTAEQHKECDSKGYKVDGEGRHVKQMQHAMDCSEVEGTSSRHTKTCIHTQVHTHIQHTNITRTVSA